MEQKDLITKIREEHPNWTDIQVVTAASIKMQADATIEQGGKDIDRNDPDIFKEIIEGAKNWLESVLPQIFVKVQQFFDNLLSTITEWIGKGIDYVIELVGKLLRA